MRRIDVSTLFPLFYFFRSWASSTASLTLAGEMQPIKAKGYVKQNGGRGASASFATHSN
jgi:hypothetical protein